MSLRYVIWSEDEPHKAVDVNYRYEALWHQFWLGLKSWWPDPRNAKRVCIGTSITLAMSPADTAEMWEAGVHRRGIKWERVGK